MIRAVIFDIDGVVIHKEKSFSQRIEVPFDVISRFFDTTFQDCLVDKADLRVELQKNMADWGWSGTVDELLEFWFAGEREIDERVVKYIQHLRKNDFRVLGATNNERYRTQYLIDNLQLEMVFDKLYSSCFVGFKKPEPEFYQFILQDQNLRENEVILWDDDHQNVEGAAEFGINARFYWSFTEMKNTMDKMLGLSVKI